MSLFSSLKSAGNASVQLGGGVQQRSQNVANANDPDYHRTEVRFTYVGNSIRLATSGRAADQGLTKELLLQGGTAGQSKVLNDYMQALSAAFGLDQTTPHLADAFQRFEQSWRDFQTNPELDSAKRAVVDAGEDLSRTINNLAASLSDLRRQAEQNIEGDVREANRLLREIGRLNSRISNASAQKQSTSILENQRDTALHKLSAILSIQTATSEEGVVTVHSRSGDLLVSGGNPQTLVYDSAAQEINLEGGTQPLASNARNQLPKGSLSAHFDMIRTGVANTTNSEDKVGFIEKYELILDQFVQSLTDTTDPVGNSFNQAFERNSGTPPFTFFEPNADRFTLAVAADLQNGNVTLDKETVQTTTDEDNIIFVLNQETRSINGTDIATVLHQEDKKYQDLINGIMTLASQTVKNYEEQSVTDISVRDNLKEQLVNRVGVNSDEELIHIQQLQTVYAANAKVISTINQMFQDLLGAI